MLVNVPTDYPTLQAAIAFIGVGVEATINIKSGHALTAGLLLNDGDYSRVTIVAEDAVVTLAPGFNQTIIAGNNTALPTLGCLIDASAQIAGDGITAYDTSRMTILPGCGIKNGWQNGLFAKGASNVSARNTIWTGSARNGNTSSGLTAWGAHIDAEGADVSNSHYYGAQAAHGGVLNFRLGKALRCFRYGVRGSDAGYMDFDGGDASYAGVIGIYAFNGSHINARSATAIGCGTSGTGGNVAATNNSHINGTEGVFAPGGIDYSIYCATGSTVSAYNAVTKRLGSMNANDMKVNTGGIIAAAGANGGTNVAVNAVTNNGIVFR